MKEFSFVDHTADICISIYSDTAEGLFTSSAEALYDAALEKSRVLTGGSVKRLKIKGENLEDLLVKFLNKLLFMFYSRHLIFRNGPEAKITIKGNTLDFQAKFVLLKDFDPLVEIKAVTYGGINIYSERNIFKTTVIADV